jgi:hypothetical protein
LRWFAWGLRQSLRSRRPTDAVVVRVPSATALGGKVQM